MLLMLRWLLHDEVLEGWIGARYEGMRETR